MQCEQDLLPAPGDLSVEAINDRLAAAVAHTKVDAVPCSTDDEEGTEDGASRAPQLHQSYLSNDKL